MLITRIELENIKSYHQVAIELRRGTTAISGANGAGKTTLVEAIGYALFNHLPYKQDQFIREGQKYGRIVIQLIGSDDRPYTVERRVGSGTRWTIYDHEADMRLEQTADVQDKLHELFGIDRERPLDSLFKDSLGVPQGTFTAIFLETPRRRKETFDALLQIEDYKNSADYLLEVQRQYKEQMQAQQSEMQRLQYETRNLDRDREQLQAARQLDEQQKLQNANWSQQLAQYEERAKVLDKQQQQLEELRQQYERRQSAYDNAQALLRRDEQLLQASQAAQQIVQASQNDFQRYQQAEETLKQLRKEAHKRNQLREQQAKLHNTLVRIETNEQNEQKRLEEVAQAEQQVLALASLVEQQMDLEKRRDELREQVTRHDTILDEGKRLSSRVQTYKQKRVSLQQRIAEIEPLVPLAERLQERNETVSSLRIQESMRSTKLQQLQEKRNELREKQVERDQAAEELRKTEVNIARIEEHRAKADEMPGLQERSQVLFGQQQRLEGNIEGYKKWRQESVGGQCPMLGEPCQNIKRRGIASLEFYFDDLLQEEHTQLTAVHQEQAKVTGRMEEIKKYVDWLSKLGRYTEKRDGYAERLQRIAIEINRVEREILVLTQELDELKLVEQHIIEAKKALQESKQADDKVRELPGLYKQAQQLQEQIQQGDVELTVLRQEIASLRGSDALLKQVQTALKALNEPRARSQAQQSIVAQKGSIEQRLQRLQHEWQMTQQQLQDLNEKLVVYASLDADISAQELLSQQSHTGYQNYLKNSDAARLLPEREHTYQQQMRLTEQTRQQLQEAERAHLAAKAAFNEAELITFKSEMQRLRDDITKLAEQMQAQQREMNRLGQEIAHAEALLAALEVAQKEYQTLEDLHTMMEMFRKLIKEAAPHVLKAMLNDISAEANRIFGEIMGDRSAQLSWQNDYEIRLRRQGIDRTFAQLSGGEQMSAALAVRLALLKKLSTLNLAFFDEPTQNMDELRRMNLAEQIRRVRGFDQLIVISHDDTFEQGLDSIVRLQKDNGETRLLGEEETRMVAALD